MLHALFASCPLEEPHLGAAARYVLLNPVRAHLAARAVDYHWSSAAFHAGLTENDPLVETNDLLGLLPDARAWLQLTEGESDAQQQQSLRQAGRPNGDRAFAERAATICGRDLTPKKRGPKTNIGFQISDVGCRIGRSKLNEKELASTYPTSDI